MHHTLQVPPAVGCCHLTFCMWLQVPVGFFRIPAPPSAFSSHACLLHREFLSALLLLPHRSECYCLLLGASLMVGVERSCPFGLVSVLCRPSEAVISHCSCQPPPQCQQNSTLYEGKHVWRGREFCALLSVARDIRAGLLDLPEWQKELAFTPPKAVAICLGLGTGEEDRKVFCSP